MKFTIVTLSFNQARYLPEAIASIHGQSGVELEHIIIDPGSDDGSREIAASMANESTVLLFEPDRGPADALLKGFERATGDVLGFINSDDWLEPGALEFVATKLDASIDADVLTGAMRIINDDSSSRWRLRTPVPFSAERYCQGITTAIQQSTFVRRSAYQRTSGINPDNSAKWDLELLVDLDLAGARFATTNRILAGFRHHGTAITQRIKDPSSPADLELQQAADEDTRRIRSKVTAAGRCEDKASRLRSAVYTMRPWKRVLEVTHVGHYAAGWSGSSG